MSPRLARSARRHSGLFVVAVALAIFGGGYAALAPTAQADEPNAADSVTVRTGQQLYNEGCITCHGRNAQGVPGRGPSLIGVGAASVEFQVGTGRMPAPGNEAQIPQKQPVYDAEETSQLAAYIQSLGGGPQVPEGTLTSDDKEVIAHGGKLFRLNCASCHGFTARGGALSSGKYAPRITTDERQTYAAMLSGPQNMPVFGDNQLTPEEKIAIISFIEAQREDQDPGGAGIGRAGPVPEGAVIFLVGMVSLVLASLWIAGKS